MKVLFSNPPWWIENPDAIYGPKIMAGVRAGSRWPFTTVVRSRPGDFQFGDYLPYPFFLGAAASYVARETGAEVAFRDSLALREGYPAFMQYLREQDFDYIVIESASPSWAHDATLIERIKGQNERARIVVTGPIAAKGEELLAQHPLTAVIRGEYEKGCVKVVNGATGLLDFDLLTEAELNAAPVPYFDELHAHRYWDSNPKGQIPPQLQIMTSRGCPFKCIFCVWPAVMTSNDPDGQGTRLVRQYTADHMEGVLTDLIGRYGYKSIYFDDDTFNLGDRHVADMCAVMQRIGLPWSAMCRADTISRDTWRLMRESGCFGVKIGFESGNQWVVDNIIHKNLDLAKAEETVRYIKDLGFTIHGTFTVGLPGETSAQMADTVRYRKSLPLDSYQESGTAEIEGSPLATLRATGHLDRYAGATLKGYIADKDGTQKRRHVALHGITLEDAKMFRTKGNPALAEAICNNLLEVDPKDAAVLNFLGVLANDAAMYDLSVRYFIRTLQANPKYYGACVNMGNLLRDQGLPDEAAVCFKHALELEPDCEDARLGLELLRIAPVPNVIRNQSRRRAVADALSGITETSWGQVLKKDLDSSGKKSSEAQPCPKNSGEAPNPAAPQGPGAATPRERTCPKIIVLDHGMRFVAGHHFAYNLGLLFECLRRNQPVDFYVHADCNKDVVKVLSAKPVLKPTQYIAHSTDKYCGYLEDFNISSKLTEFNLYKNLKGNVDPEDLIYVHTADPKIVMGIAAWYVSLSKEKRPYLCLKFQNHGYRFVVKSYRALVQSVFRLALKPFIGMDKVSYAASNKLIAAQIQLVAEKPCPVFPIPLQLTHAARPYQSRREKQVIRIGYAGEGRTEQGVDMLPDIVDAVLAAYPDVQFVLQFGCHFAEKETLSRLRACGERVKLIEQCLVGDHFHELLRSFDALLLPYTPDRYIERSSQIVIEAIALGVPLIVPARTSLAFEAKEFDCGYTLIQKHQVASIVEAISDFIDNHDALSQKSVPAAERCANFHCGRTLVDLLVDTCTA